MKGKVGLVTLYHVPNFGSVLQAYATQEVIRKLGYECMVIKYKYPNEWHYSQGRLKSSLKYKIAYLMGLKPAHRKAKKLEMFRRKFLNFSHPYKNLEELKAEDWSGYQAVTVGSDQVWNARFTFADSVFMLSFLPQSIHRFSIASSFAAKTLPEKVRDKYYKYLSRFDAISVRENNGINIIIKELGIKCSPRVLLDPTLLLSHEDWLSLVPRSKFVKRKKYILLYMLTYAFEPRPYIFNVLKYMQRKYNYEILALEGYTSPKHANGVVMQNMTDSDVSMFIDLFNNADMVVTSSFHGTAFAVNFGIPLLSIIPEDKGDDRQTNLLNIIGANNCITNLGKKLNELSPFYEKNRTDQILKLTRKSSLEWIKEKLA